MSLRRAAVALGLLLVAEKSARATLAAGPSETREPGASDAQPIAPPPAPVAEAVAEPIVVTLRPARGALLSGIDRELAVMVDVSGPGAERFVPARAFATVGTLEMPVAAGPGHFTTRYLPPADRIPQVALLVRWSCRTAMPRASTPRPASRWRDRRWSPFTPAAARR